MNLAPYYELRDRLADFLESDLTGPRHDDEARREEIIDNWPLTRYATGILYPRQGGQMAALDAEQDQADVADEDDGTGERESPVALANMRYPSSMGCSFAVDPLAAPFITIHARAARYINEVPGDSFVTDGEEVVQQPDPDAPRSYGRKPGLWKRQPLDIAPVTLDVRALGQGTHPDFRAQGLSLFYRVRATGEGCRAVTLILVNEQNQPVSEKRDAHAIFNAQLEVTGPRLETEAFVERPPRGSNSNDDEVRSARLLYRHAREFATGHGIAVEWDKTSPDSARAIAIRTQWTPRFEVLSADANPTIGSPFLEFAKLANGERPEITRGLDEFCLSYQSWIEAQEAQIPSLHLGGELEATARQHLDACRHIAARMKGGVQILREDDLSWRAWQLANRAMLRQRARANWLRGGKKTAAPDEGAAGLAWRPFQLGFILLCLESIAQPESEARQIADLLWFPTGGGKTEAYLGLIAFCALRRRLQKRDGGAGVTALMRYTLRLLTLQQFERATLLICSLESLRREMGAELLGSVPISVGLWLGNAATPNTVANAKNAVKMLRDKGDLENSFNQLGNPVQVRNCPWCGAALDANNYTFTRSKPERMVVSCRKENCEFHDGLPVHLIDEDVYGARPTLLIATVDKFASLPWRGDDTASLFGFKTKTQNALPAPELIIQDELHLISGPLGTMVGLYETAIDLACETVGPRPKIVASTATIRRAKDQGRALFNRRVEQFPPPALDARDSYFARQASSESKASRCYLGVMANGLSNANATNRIYAALLQSVAQLPAADEIKDPYWTLVGYFNSLRVLGSTLLQVADVVPDYMQALATQSAAAVRPMNEERRIEMNSHVSSSDVPKFLKRMDLKYPSASGKPDEAPLDVILATNMISVGVDINRLGLMSVMGQPQTTSEYIQATSRVGREFPGLVVVQFNPARSRDRSHYESFESYHSALYRQVEATSVTPFSARARDRGLHAILIALARQRIGGLRENESAERVGNFDGALDEIIGAIVKRVGEVTGDSIEAEATRVHLQEIRRGWKQRAEDETLKYRAQTMMDSLMWDAGELKVQRSDCLPTLWSLRDVDPESNLYFHRIFDEAK